VFEREREREKERKRERERGKRITKQSETVKVRKCA
jgi:hypothetical protein